MILFFVTSGFSASAASKLATVVGGVGGGGGVVAAAAAVAAAAGSSGGNTTSFFTSISWTGGCVSVCLFRLCQWSELFWRHVKSQRLHLTGFSFVCCK